METISVTVDQLADLIAAGTKEAIDRTVAPLLKQHGAVLEQAVALRRTRNQQRRKEARLASMQAAAILKADEAQGVVEVIANTTGVRDLQGDTLLPGCFGDVIAAGARPAVCWQHDISKVLGRVVYMQELAPGDERVPFNQTRRATDPLAGGLLIRAQMAMTTQQGREAFDLIAGGYVDEYSIAFFGDPSSDKVDKESGGIIFAKITDLLEVSPVVRGASLQTGTLSAKGAGDYIIEERLAQLSGPSTPDGWTRGGPAGPAWMGFAEGQAAQAEVFYFLSRAAATARITTALGVPPPEALNLDVNQRIALAATNGQVMAMHDATARALQIIHAAMQSSGVTCNCGG